METINLNIPWRNQPLTVPQFNCLGDNRFLNDSLIKQFAGINPGDRALDIGGGNNPFEFCTHVLDNDADNRPRNPGYQNAVGSFENIPFPDKYFDFVITKHTLEHVGDFTASLNEMKRVGRQGLVITPSPLYEYCMGSDCHNYIIAKNGNILYGMRKWFAKFPLSNFAWGLTYFSPLFLETVFYLYRPLWETHFYWNEDFDFVEIRDEDLSAGAYFDEADSRHKCAAKLDFFVNGLMNWEKALPLLKKYPAFEARGNCETSKVKIAQLGLYLLKMDDDALPPGIKKRVLSLLHDFFFIFHHRHEAGKVNPSDLEAVIGFLETIPPLEAEKKLLARRIDTMNPESVRDKLQVEPEQRTIEIIPNEGKPSGIGLVHRIENFDRDGYRPPFSAGSFHLAIVRGGFSRTRKPESLAEELGRISKWTLVEEPTLLESAFNFDPRQRWFVPHEHPDLPFSLVGIPVDSQVPFPNIFPPLDGYLTAPQRRASGRMLMRYQRLFEGAPKVRTQGGDGLYDPSNPRNFNLRNALYQSYNEAFKV